MPRINNNLPVPGSVGVQTTNSTIGAAADVQNRLIAQLVNWFGTDHELLDTVLQAYVTTGVFNYSQLAYDNLQMRLQTATDDNLDLISQDYFNGYLPRRTNESDDTYRQRITSALLLQRATRPGMDNALYVLTGFHPILFEPWRPFDCGGYNAAATAQSIGYGTHGSYGSGSYPYQAFIDVFLSAYSAMASRSGYNDYYFGYDAAGAPAIGWYGGETELSAIITEEDIYQCINLTKCEGTVCWVSIHRI